MPRCVLCVSVVKGFSSHGISFAMRSALALLLALTCAGSSTSSPPSNSATQQLSNPTYDIRILHGDVIDGTGKPRFRADVGIRGDAIAAIGDLTNASST